MTDNEYNLSEPSNSEHPTFTRVFEGLMTEAQTEAPPLERARRKLAELEAMDDQAEEYAKVTVTREQSAVVYIRLLPGTKPCDIPHELIKEAAAGLDRLDWQSVPGVSVSCACRCDAQEARVYDDGDMIETEIRDARAKLARLESEALK